MSSLKDRFEASSLPEPPVPPFFKPKKLRMHGKTRTDPFYAIRNLSDPAVKRYLNAENRYARTVMRADAPLFRILNREIGKRIPKADCSVPVIIGEYAYYMRTRPKFDYPFYCRKKGLRGSKEEVILDVNPLAEGAECCLVTGVAVSPDHTQLAYGITREGGIDYELRFRNLTTGKELKDRIRRTDGEAAWSEDNLHVFYTLRDRGDLRAFRVMRHRLGSSPKEDVLLYEETDTEFECSVWKSKSDEFIFISSASSDTTEHRFADARTPFADFTLLSGRIPGVEYYPEQRGNQFFILTNAFNAPDFQLMKRLVAAPPDSAWEPFVPHVPGRLIEDFELFGGKIALIERENALQRLKVILSEADALNQIVLPEVCGSIAFDENADVDADFIRVTVSSMSQVARTLQYDFTQGKKERESVPKVLKTQKVRNFDASCYASELLRVPSRDGKSFIPLSIVWRKDRVPGIAAPLILRGYGAYGISSDADFRVSRLSLLDRGVVCAIAHVRGGEELGRKWYEEGHLMHKKNSFYDFIDCAEYLFKEGWTTPEKLIIGGGSAGGLLIAAALNEKPDFCLGAVLDVPFVDVLNTMTDPGLPLTKGEYAEWGNPADPQAFKYIGSYSPYDHLNSGRTYPHLYINAGLNDTQVPYWEPAKYTAKLRTLDLPERRLILLRTQMNSGHLGPTGRKAEIAEIAREFTFCLSLFGLDK